MEPVRARQFPIVGAGGGVSSFIHLDDAAAATVLAIEHDVAGIYNVVDDEPAPVREWLPVLAKALGAKPPRHFPRWLARLFAGDAAVMMGTEARGASNAKAKRELGLAAALPQLAPGLRGGLRGNHPGGGTQRSPDRPCEPLADLTPRGAGPERARGRRRRPLASASTACP